MLGQVKCLSLTSMKRTYHKGLRHLYLTLRKFSLLYQTGPFCVESQCLAFCVRELQELFQLYMSFCEEHNGSWLSNYLIM